MLVPIKAIRGFRRNAWRRNLGNFSLIKHRHCDGHLLSMHQSGTHWLKFMLANALSHQYGTPPPQYNHANDIIGGPGSDPHYKQLPRLFSSHTVAHPLLGVRLFHRFLGLPPYVLLIRDIRATLVSNYTKWREAYGTSFSEYLLGDPRGNRYNSDIWWALRFLNSWSRVKRNVPERLLTVHYENLVNDPAKELSRVAAAFNLKLSSLSIAHGVDESSKEQMETKNDPDRPPGAVNMLPIDMSGEFAAGDRRIFETICAKCLNSNFGYDYTVWKT